MHKIHRKVSKSEERALIGQMINAINAQANELTQLRVYIGSIIAKTTALCKKLGVDEEELNKMSKEILEEEIKKQEKDKEAASSETKELVSS